MAISSRAGYQARHDLRDTIAPIGAGSVIGAIIGGLLVGIAPSAILNVGLGIILNLVGEPDLLPPLRVLRFWIIGYYYVSPGALKKSPRCYPFAFAGAGSGACCCC
jgi:uncharacterized membrane protein YfcA